MLQIPQISAKCLKNSLIQDSFVEYGRQSIAFVVIVQKMIEAKLQMQSIENDSALQTFGGPPEFAKIVAKEATQTRHAASFELETKQQKF